MTTAPEDLILRAALEWVNPTLDELVVRIELGDEPVLRVSDNEGETWHRIKVAEMGDLLGDWLEARRAL